MNTPFLELRPLKAEDERSFMEAVHEFQRDDPWDFALGYDDSMSFIDYVRKNEEWSRGENLPSCFVPASFYVGVVDDVVVGRLSLRHELNDFLFKVDGHIGYGVRPSQRERGYATAMLRQVIPIAAKAGIKRALITCDVGNIASMKVIERCGGVFECVPDDPSLDVQKRRYWIPTL
ncbi:MAG: GNAT family N-acetyltransferase [Fimbriimonadaceae bacterium]